MPRVLDPFRFLLISVAGWMNQSQLQVIDYLREENRVLRQQLGGRRLRLNDEWGYRRIQGALSHLGHDIARSTIADILNGAGSSQRQSGNERQLGKNF
jgi:hypothetical protein